MTQAIERISPPSPEVFLRDFARQNRPAVITGALTDWKLSERWTPAALRQRLGAEKVQVYNSYFDLVNMMSLDKYFTTYFDRATPPKPVPYVRWYTKLRDVNFIWADKAFQVLSDSWSRPSFLPETDYVLPWRPGAQQADPVSDYFPAKGLFISGRGAKTGLHVDPWGSDAVLCQLFGKKTWQMYSPELTPALTNGKHTVDPDAPDHTRFPRFKSTPPTYEFSVEPGDCVYVPAGWHHHVRTDSDSISLTWNFVHRTTAHLFESWLSREVNPNDLTVVQFFFKGVEGNPKSLAELRAFLGRHLNGPTAKAG